MSIHIGFDIIRNMKFKVFVLGFESERFGLDFVCILCS